MNKTKHTASASDGKEILRILESSAAKGSIELIYTRRPDAYESYMKEPGEAHVFISKKDGRAVGTCAQLIREVYIGGKESHTAYICGLKKDAQYDGSVGFGAEFIRSLYRDETDFCFCSVLSDNKDAQKMFSTGKRLISLNPFAQYRTYILNPKVKIKAPENSLSFCRAREEDAPELISFLNREGRKKDLFPVIRSLNGFCGLSASDFYFLKDGERIAAAAALWNQKSYKQYVVKKYGGLMKLSRAVNPLLSLLGYIKLPKEDTPLNLPMLAFFLAEGDKENYYRIFLTHILREVKKNYDMLVIGIPKRHFAARIYESVPNIHFDTVFYSIDFPWSGKESQKPDSDRLYPECGLL